MAASETIQTISRLTPLVEVLALIDLRVKPVASRTLDISAAAGRTLATDASATLRPAAALALTDGWAVAAELTLGASDYAPVVLPQAPRRIEAGAPLPSGADSIAPIDAIRTGDGLAEALTPINPGDGVLPPGGDSDPGIPLRRAGERLRLTDLAAFAAAGRARVTVREPRIRVLPVRDDAIIVAAARLVAGDIDRRGGVAMLEAAGRDMADVLAADHSDAVVVIGGTGSGRNDDSIQIVARDGDLALHGIAVTPGETAAFGFIGAQPVLLLAGRVDSALAIWLTVGRHVQDRLAGAQRDDGDTLETMPLARKVTSTVGLVEVVPVRCHNNQAEPLASKYLSLSSLTRSDGWILVPAESEGYSVGAPVWVRPWP
ncbi:MAG: molybdopterin-binding protein [Rhodopseudomonas sp.]|nr:molybdopterin-binding protein [Rhodopseudomonas sp.]